MTRVIGLAGWSGAGKTVLIAKLIPVLNARGLTVSTLKHAHHAFDIDRPGKDSYVHREAGATEVLVASSNRWALMHELRGAPEPSLEELLRHFSPVDLILIEGFKRDPHPKIEVHRAANGKSFLYPEDPNILALATDAQDAKLPLPSAHLDDTAAIADLMWTLALPLDETLARLSAHDPEKLSAGTA
ncbi:molybdopterin-guanine dinucleotide biosynthesis protein B [Methyloferula stellata]|uniref:molybdopterin-guanine dinucleotide biosynthesis protein B n=1 Tax=Methyloferula stellata TaxID=876270 RepID=UPI000378609D|nr:molybdopterin-guanine dinucleotide biosynthesis protein B [Methyloferula stellata]